MRQVRLKIEYQYIADEFWAILRYGNIQFILEKTLDKHYLSVGLNDVNTLKDRIKYSQSKIKDDLTEVFETALITTLTN